MEALESFKTVTLWLAAGTEAVAALIIGLNGFLLYGTFFG